MSGVTARETSEKASRMERASRSLSLRTPRIFSSSRVIRRRPPPLHSASSVMCPDVASAPHASHHLPRPPSRSWSVLERFDAKGIKNVEEPSDRGTHRLFQKSGCPRRRLNRAARRMGIFARTSRTSRTSRRASASRAAAAPPPAVVPKKYSGSLPFEALDDRGWLGHPD